MEIANEARLMYVSIPKKRVSPLGLESNIWKKVNGMRFQSLRKGLVLSDGVGASSP